MCRTSYGPGASRPPGQNGHGPSGRLGRRWRHGVTTTLAPINGSIRSSASPMDLWPARSVQAEAEGVPRRVEEHPEGGTGLVLVPGRAEAGHRRLGDVEVVDDDVEMHLLGYLLSRPPGRGIGLHLLEGDALAVLRADMRPAGGDFGLPVQHGAVEGRERGR